jgi:hypothetical protein
LIDQKLTKKELLTALLERALAEAAGPDQDRKA